MIGIVVYLLISAFITGLYTVEHDVGFSTFFTFLACIFWPILLCISLGMFVRNKWWRC